MILLSDKFSKCTNKYQRASSKMEKWAVEEYTQVEQQVSFPSQNFLQMAIELTKFRMSSWFLKRIVNAFIDLFSGQTIKGNFKENRIGCLRSCAAPMWYLLFTSSTINVTLLSNKMQYFVTHCLRICCVIRSMPSYYPECQVPGQGACSGMDGL